MEEKTTENKIDELFKPYGLVFSQLNKIVFSNIHLNQLAEGKKLISELAVELISNQNDEDLKDFLWNKIEIIDLEYPIENRGFSEKALAFITERFEAEKRYDEKWVYRNINAPFETERLLLRPLDLDRDDLKTYQYHLLNDGDFKLFTGLNETSENVERFSRHINYPMCFMVEKKESNTLIGYVNIRFDSHTSNRNHFSLSQFEGDYYIFKKERGKGYAREAMAALLSQAFEKKIKRLVHAKRSLVQVQKTIDPLYVRLSIKTHNHASIGLAKNLGFDKEGILHSLSLEDDKAIDYEIYYLSKEKYNQNKFYNNPSKTKTNTV
jgi:RimJ/RimL family protein N-acetyltransferase